MNRYFFAIYGGLETYMEQQNERIPITEQQAAYSFVKAYADWFGLGKMHLSFVSHTGRKAGCSQNGAIEASLPIYHGTGKMLASAEGKQRPEDSASGLEKLVLMVNSGILSKKIAASAKEADGKSASGKIFADSVFETIGGSPAKEKDGKVTPVRYRKLSVSPAMFEKGAITSNIALQVMECDGEMSATGGYVPKSGFPNKSLISVQFKYAEFCVFVMAMENAWEAELTRRAILGEKEFWNWFDHKEQTSAPASQNAPIAPAASAVQVSAPPVEEKVIVAYDSLGITFTVSKVSTFEAVMKSNVGQLLQDEKKYVVAKDSWNSLIEAVKRGDDTLPCITAVSKVDKSEIIITSVVKLVQ